MEIDTVHDGFSVVVFMNVHEIVHDPFLASVKGIIPVITLVCGIVEFWVSGIFVNNWAILFFLVSLCSASDVVSRWFCGVHACDLFLSCS